MSVSSGLRLAGLLAAACLVACDQPAEEQSAPFLAQYDKIDYLIENGSVFDGYGNPPVRANVVIVGDTIVYVGETAFTEHDLANRVVNRIDAYDKAVTPGFIDLHAHGDPLATPEFENFLAMGVTTIVLGQDGSSPDVEPLSAWLTQVSEQGIGTNLAMFVGHGTLRDQAGIGRSASPETEDMERMLEMLDRTLQYTFGLSTGLEYNPGLNATTDELRALAKVVGRNNRMIMSHMRNEDDEELENSIAELLEQGEDARVHISHLKSVYGKGSERAEELLQVLAAARDAGTSITADIYPYTASYTGIDILFPVWAKTAEQFAIARAERRDELAQFLRDKVNRRNGPEATLLGTEPYTGKTLAELSFEMELPFEDVLIDVIGPDGASGAYFVMDDALQARLLQDPNVGVCSDGSPTGFHPRGHGTFAKIIEKYVLDENLLSPSEAISKLTAFPANILGIADRGAVRENMIADLLIFDMEAVHAPASYPEPHQLAQGFDIVIVNGRIARQYGVQERNLYGRVLAP
jgi:N-acyl-D-aspartate/D-glutamate deacylase